MINVKLEREDEVKFENQMKIKNLTRRRMEHNTYINNIYKDKI